MGWLGRVLSGTTLAIALLACSSGNEQGRGGGGGGIGPGGGSGGLGGTGSFGGGTGSFGGGTGGGFGGTGGVTGTDGGPIDDPNVCGGDTVEPEIIEVTTEVEITRAEPIAIYIMLDQSGSMITLWPGAVQAITDFVNDPQSAGLDVALGLFPPPNFGDGCLAGSYNPPPVPLGRLPGHAGAITGGLPGGPVGIGTPIEGALKGATEFCRNFTPADPADAGEECIVLFITDGAPSGCAEDTPSIVSVAQNGGVPVYTIALQGVSDLTLLNMIASVTGTTCGGVQGACDLRNGASFADTLAAIRDDVVTVETVTEQVKQALTCEWGIPAPSDDMPFDKDLVNVIFTATPGADGQTFVNVPGEADCAGNAGAWYYDNPDDPQRIHACPQTCTTLEASPDGAVDIQLGCPIVVVE